MKLIEARKIEDCFDGGSRYEFRFNNEIAEAFMRRLVGAGRLDFFPEFPKPFFKIFRSDGSQVKGILGSMDIEVYFTRSHSDEKIIEFEMELQQLLDSGDQ